MFSLKLLNQAFFIEQADNKDSRKLNRVGKTI